MLHSNSDDVGSENLEDSVEIRYLDTMARWTFFCSAWRTRANGTGAGMEAKVEDGIGVKREETTEGDAENRAENILYLRRTPDLVVVQGLSRYLDEQRNKG